MDFKKRVAAAAVSLLFAAAGACAEVAVPSNACFSPGMKRVSNAIDAGQGSRMQAAVTVDNAFYARDLSVLGAMLNGLTFTAENGAGTDTLTVTRGEETLFAAALTQDEAGYCVSLNGQTFALNGESNGDMLEKLTLLQKSDSLNGFPVLERMPLSRVQAYLEANHAETAILPGVKVKEPLVREYTYSDDGTRLTKITLNGQVEVGGAVWTLSGFMRQPAGTKPKDTAEFTLTQDEKNFFEISYSAVRESTGSYKAKKGTAGVTTALKVAGKLNGYAMSSRLNVRQRNDWTVTGDDLNEKITVTVSLSHTDKAPERRMQRLNDVSAENKHMLRVSSPVESETEANPAFTDKMTISVTMDGQTFLTAGADVSAQVGTEPPAPVTQAEHPADEAAQAFAASARELTTCLYQGLSSGAKEKVLKGL